MRQLKQSKAKVVELLTKLALGGLLCGLAGCSVLVREVGSAIWKRGMPDAAQCFLFYREQMEVTVITTDEQGVQVEVAPVQPLHELHELEAGE